MTPTYSYQLFVSSKCNCSDKIMSYIKTEKIDIEITNVDEEEYNLPFSIMMFPALVLGNKLISYGCEDIISKLNAA